MDLAEKKEEILNKLKIFDNIRFSEADHKYWFEGISIDPAELRSATTIAGTLHKPFDSEYWATKKAKERGCTKEMILEEWDGKAKRACNKGTLVHYYMECNLSGKPFSIPANLSDEDTVRGFERTKQAADRFLAMNVCTGDLLPVRSETKVGIPEWRTVGTIDQLFLDENGKLWIYDWKTNGKFTTENRWENLLAPFEDLQDTNFNAYSVQLAIYRLILEKIGLEIEGCKLVWLPEATGVHTEYECLDLRERTKMLIVPEKLHEIA